MSVFHSIYNTSLKIKCVQKMSEPTNTFGTQTGTDFPPPDLAQEQQEEEEEEQQDFNEAEDFSGNLGRDLVCDQLTLWLQRS